MKNFNDTNIPQTFSTGLYAEKQYNVSKDHAWKTLDILINGAAEVLRDLKSKEHPVVFIFKNNDDFLMAAIVQYFPGESESDPGNWAMTWTFEKDDLPTEDQKPRFITPYDADMASYFWTYGIHHHNFAFKTSEYLGVASNYMIKLIMKWLDENASDTEEVGVELPGVVTFRVAVEDGKKFFSCEVDGEIKQKIKDDAAIEA